jgi:hypothetical protein
MLVFAVDINMSDRRSDIGPKENLRLSESEREYLETGEIPGTYSQQNIESRVRDTVRKLPVRIDILAEDVELLDETSRETIPFEDWRECWFEVIGLEHERTQHEIEQAYTYTHSDETQYPTSGLVEFGEALGRLANSLYITENKEGWFEGYNQIILGFVNGICQMEDERGAGDYREEVIDFITRELKKQSESLAQIDDATTEEKDEYFENIKKAREIIREILDEEGIQPTPAPIWVLEKAKGKHVRTSEFDPRKMQVAGDVPVEDEFTKETVLEIVEEEKLCEKGAVFELIFEDDFDRVIDTHWRGVEAAEIIDLMFQSEKCNMSPSEINDGLNSQKVHRKTIPKLMADLSGRESPWDERPLLQESRNGWKLTNYGKAMADCFSKRAQIHGTDEVLPRFPSEDLLEAAFEDLDLSEQR